VSTADLGIIANTVVDLAAIGGVTWLIHAKRIVFAATPKPPQAQQSGQQQRQDKPETPKLGVA